MRPTAPKNMYTRTLYNARSSTTSSLLRGKNSANTWLWLKTMMVHAWRNTTPTALQLLGHSQPINDAYDFSNSAGLQTPQTFATMGELYNTYIMLQFYTKNKFVLRNINPTGNTQSIDLLLIDWFDTNQDAITQINDIVAALPAVNWNNVYDRLKNMQNNVRLRRKTITTTPNSQDVQITFSRKMSLAKIYSNSKIDFRHPFHSTSPTFPLVHLYGYSIAGAATSPLQKWYYHNAVINLGGMTDTSSLFPSNSATNSMIHMDTGMYVKFYDPVIHTVPNPL